MQAAAMMDMHTVAMRSHIQKMLQQMPSRKMGRVQVGAPRTLTKTATAVTLESKNKKIIMIIMNITVMTKIPFRKNLKEKFGHIKKKLII